MSQKMKLISFKLCPFVQRAVIVLKNKNIDFDMTYIDINDPPEWFKTLSPLGEVPILKVGEEVLFESSVIQEYVDEVTTPSLHPTNLLLKAKNRAWMTFSGDLLMGVMQITRTKSAEDYEKIKTTILEKLGRLEKASSGEKFFNNNEFNLIDATYAPFFMRLNFINQSCGEDILEGFPKLQIWSKNCLDRKCVQNSVVPELPQMFKGMLKHMDGYLATRLK